MRIKKVPSLYYEKDLKNLARQIDFALKSTKIVLDIGGTPESDFHSWLSEESRGKITNVNPYGSPSMDAKSLPFRDRSIDAVISFNTLEHIDDDNQAIREMRRVLKPGGFACVTVPFLESFHGYPGDYRRYTTMELDRKFSWLSSRKTHACAYFGSAMAVNFANALGHGKKIRGSVAAYMFFWLKYLDIYYRTRQESHRNALCLYVMGYKSTDNNKEAF